ncbi:hypothetical protein [Streptomyces globosus]|uniref:hypothetical protein n=1 Tax=Streptomyces globosus TaxID=68209 RepID=UPI0031D5E12F
MQRALAAVEDTARGYRLGWYGRPQEPPQQVDEERGRLEARLQQLLEGAEA